MPDERAMAEASDELTEALRVTRSAREAELGPQHTGVAMDERQTFSWLVERSNRLAEIESRAEAPDADEEALWASILGVDAQNDGEDAVREAIEALIAYRERRYEAVARLLRESLDWHDRLISDFDIGEARDEQLTQHMDDIRSALRALSERSDG